MFNSSSFPALCCRRGMESLAIFVLKGVMAFIVRFRDSMCRCNILKS